MRKNLIDKSMEKDSSLVNSLQISNKNSNNLSNQLLKNSKNQNKPGVGRQKIIDESNEDGKSENMDQVNELDIEKISRKSTLTKGK